MIDWETINPALLALFEQLAVDTPGTFRAEHKDRSRKMMSNVHKRVLTIELKRVETIGIDEVRTGLVPMDATGEDEPYRGLVMSLVTGQRVMLWELACDTVVNTDADWAWATIERIRTRLRRPSSLAALEAVGVCMNEIGPAVQANFLNQGAMHNRVLLEVWLNVVVNDVDPNPVAGVGVIKQVEFSSHLEDVDGIELPVPPNVFKSITPP